VVTEFSCEMEQMKNDNIILTFQTQDLPNRLGKNSDSDAESKLPETQFPQRSLPTCLARQVIKGMLLASVVFLLH
jgi:hypothetical protein